MSSRWRETGFWLFLYSSRSAINTTRGSIDEGSTKTKVSSPFVLFKRHDASKEIVRNKCWNCCCSQINKSYDELSCKEDAKNCCFVLKLPWIRSMPFVAGMNWQFNYFGVLSKERVRRQLLFWWKNSNFDWTLGYIVLFLAKGHNKDSRGRFNNGHDYKTFPNWVK